jgi:flagellar protein FlaH
MTTDHYSLGLGERDRVDHAFGGGLPHGSLVLIEGGDGAGKSVITQRMTYGMAAEGTHVAVVSTELTAREYIDQMHSLAYDVVDHLLTEQVLFLHADVDTHVQRGDTIEGTRPLIAQLTGPSAVWRADVVVVDGFGSLLRNDPGFDSAAANGDEDHLVQGFISFIRQVTATGSSVVLTVNPSLVSDRALQPIRDVAEVYLSIERSTVGQEIRRKALVHRFAGMKRPVDDTIGFDVQQGRGLVIVSRTVA